MKSNAPAPARTVLIASLGTTPAVVTETVWALAHGQSPVIPDRVVTITTVAGSEKLRQQLLEAPVGRAPRRSVWSALRHAILGPRAAHDPRLVLDEPSIIAAPDLRAGTSRPLDDIRSAADNEAAAESILSVVRQFTTDPDTRVIGLLAGGRKTMSALLHAALSLAGRPGDRLLHVLVNPPFDRPDLEPPLYFPGQPGTTTHQLRDGTAVPHAEARIEIAEVPLVALGELVADQTGHHPATFTALTRSVGEAVADLRTRRQPVRLRYEPEERTLSINAARAVLPRGRCAALTQFLWERARADAEHLRNADLQEALETAGRTYDYNGARRKFTEDDVNKALNELRDGVKKAAGAALCDRLLPRRQPVGFNREGVTLADG